MSDILENPNEISCYQIIVGIQRFSHIKNFRIALALLYGEEIDSDSAAVIYSKEPQTLSACLRLQRTAKQIIFRNMTNLKNLKNQQDAVNLHKKIMLLSESEMNFLRKTTIKQLTVQDVHTMQKQNKNSIIFSKRKKQDIIDALKDGYKPKKKKPLRQPTIKELYDEICVKR